MIYEGIQLLYNIFVKYKNAILSVIIIFEKSCNSSKLLILILNNFCKINFSFVSKVVIFLNSLILRFVNDELILNSYDVK